MTRLMVARVRVCMLTYVLVCIGIGAAQAQTKRTLLQEDIGFVNASLYGTAFTNATISAAISAIGSSTRVLFLPTGTWTIGSSLNIPSNITLYIPSGTTITVNAGNVLSLATIPQYDQPYWLAGAGTMVINDATWPIDPRVYGAIGDGATDNTTALNAALAAASTTNGAIVFPCGTYNFGTTLTVLNGANIKLFGPASGRGTSTDQCVTLNYTGNSGAGLWFDGTVGVEIGYLSISYSSGSYASSSLVRINQVSGSVPTRGVYIHDGSLFGTAASSKTATRLLYIDTASDITVERLSFGNSIHAIDGAQTAANTTVNVRIRDCRFETTLSGTAIDAGGTGWVIEGNRFFVTSTNAGLAFNTTAVGVTGLLYSGNVHLGANSASTNWWYAQNGAVNGAMLVGNTFLDSNSSSFCVRPGSSVGVTVMGNSLNCGTGVSGGSGAATYLVMLGNSNGSTNPLFTYPGIGSMTQFGSGVGTTQITLGTAGSAAGLKVVCYDPTSNVGQFRISSTGTDCSN